MAIPARASGNRTRLHGRRQRILEGHLVVDGKDLVVFETHWTSRLRETSEHGREDYADKVPASQLTTAIERHYFNLLEEQPHRVHTRLEPKP